jgi:hypothetical protein
MIGAAIIPAIPPTGKNLIGTKVLDISNTLKHKKVSLYTRKQLETISDEVFELCIESAGITILIKCIRYLQDVTFYYTDSDGSERMELDGQGLAVGDVTNSAKIINSLTKWHPSGDVVKRAVLFVYRYREQLRGVGYDIPECIFSAEG